jgi:GNAT superfamily N-acetyltransferase
VITEAETLEAIERTGRGWVVELHGHIVGFAVVNAQDGNVWALFMDPAHERRGYGRRLHDEMLEWSWAQGLGRLWLSTEPGTRAERFYETAGWTNLGRTDKGEVHFMMQNPSAKA